MSKARTVRFSDQLDSMVDEYIQKNGLKFNQFIKLAVEKYIRDPNTIELIPVDDKGWEELTEKNFAKHKEAMDELK